MSPFVAEAGTENGPFQLINADATGVTLEYTAPEPGLGRTTSALGSFDEITLDDHARLAFLGRPALPVRSVGIGIPEGADVTITVEPLETRTLSGLKPAPSPEGPVEPEGGPVSNLENQALDADFYATGALWPKLAVEYKELGHLRHHRVGQVVVTPMQWDPRTSDITFLKRARVRVDFRRPAGKVSAPAIPVGREEAWEHLYESTLFNYESARAFRTRPMPARDSGRLIPKGAARPTGVNPEYRLHIGKSGLYRVTYADLASIGWPSDLPVDQIRLFEKLRNDEDPSNPLTIEVPIHIQEYDGTPGVFDQSDGFVFMAQDYRERFAATVQERRYTDLHVYWLTWAPSGGTRMEVDPGWIEGTVFQTPSSFFHKTHYEENRHYVYPSPNPNMIGYIESPTWETMYWLVPFAPRDSLEFQTVARDPGKPFQIEAQWQGYFPGTHKVTLWQTRGVANDDTLLTFRREFGQHDVFRFDSGDLPGTRLADGKNLFKLTGHSLNSQGVEIPISGAYFDWLDVSYNRFYVASDNHLAFDNSGLVGDVEFAIRGLREPELVLVDVTEPQSPKWVDLSGATITQISGPPSREFELKFRARLSGDRNYILYTDTGLPSFRTGFRTGRFPVDVGPTNLVLDSVRNVTTDTGADVIVLTHPTFEPALAPWLALRESQGHRIRLVSPQDVYDQFSGGDKSVPAIRDWLRYIYRNWNVPPDYLVLAGDASEDYRRDLLTSDPDWVPTMMYLGPVPGDLNRYELVGQDNYFTRSLGRNDPEADLLPEMHVGRLPIGSVTEAEILVNKLVAYDTYSSSDAWRNRGLITSDDKYSTPISDGTAYAYSRSDCDFEAGADSVLSLFAARGCHTDFSLDDLRLGDCLNGVPGLGRMDVMRSECPILPFHRASLAATSSYVASNCTPQWVDESSRGHLFQIYSGHGNRFVMSTERWVDYFNGRGTSDRLTNFGKPFVFFGIACHLNEFESSDEVISKHSLGEAMLFLPNAGAIASMASTGFEWLITNYWVEVYMAENVFIDNPRDPDTGRPRRILGEGIDQALFRMAAERGGGIFLNTFRTYFLLGDPTQRLDMAPPRFDVTVNGEPVSSGAELVASAGSRTARIEARIADDVDAIGSGFVIHEGDSTVTADLYTLTPFDGSGEGACRGVNLVYEPTLRADSYTIDLKLADWLGRDGAFQLNVNLDVDFRLDGRPLGEDEFVPRDAGIEVLITSPVELNPSDIVILLNGQPGHFTLEPETGNRSWTARVSGALPAGRVNLTARILGREARTISVNAGDDLNFSDVYFYPNPWDGKTPARFTYQLRYKEGDRPRKVTVTLYTVSGRRVVTLDGPVDGGRTWLDWDGRDGRGDEIANGVYLYKLTIDLADGNKLTRIDRLVVHR